MMQSVILKIKSSTSTSETATSATVASKTRSASTWKRPNDNSSNGKDRRQKISIRTQQLLDEIQAARPRTPPRDDESIEFFNENGFGIADPDRERTPTSSQLDQAESPTTKECLPEEIRRAFAGEESIFDEKLRNGEFGAVGAAYLARSTHKNRTWNNLDM